MYSCQYRFSDAILEVLEREAVQRWLKTLPEDKQEAIKEAQKIMSEEYVAPMDVVRKVWIDYGLGKEWESHLCREVRSIQEGGREYPFQPEPYDTYLMDNPAIYDILEKKPSTYVVTADDMKKHYIKTTGITSRMVGLNEDFSLRLYDTGKSGRM
mmetsp:Transcript_39819/g.102578  ORF Transcript_39819/g.102578 Transcript_39819/m.102578 type:complete len:155 (-) Transcript_39819:2614-3078(-)